MTTVYQECNKDAFIPPLSEKMRDAMVALYTWSGPSWSGWCNNAGEYATCRALCNRGLLDPGFIAKFTPLGRCVARELAADRRPPKGKVL